MNSEYCEDVRNTVSVYKLEPAIGVDGWRRKWCRVIQFGKNREVFRWRAVGGRESWSQRGIRRGYDQVKNVFFVVSRKIRVLTEVERGEKRQKLRNEVIRGVIIRSVQPFLKGS